MRVRKPRHKSSVGFHIRYMKYLIVVDDSKRPQEMSTTKKKPTEFSEIFLFLYDVANFFSFSTTTQNSTIKMPMKASLIDEIYFAIILLHISSPVLLLLPSILLTPFFLKLPPHIQHTHSVTVRAQEIVFLNDITFSSFHLFFSP